MTHPNLFGGYETADDLASKICNEGFDYYFGDYTGSESFAGSELEKPVAEYIAAKEKLHAALADAGVDLDQ